MRLLLMVLTECAPWMLSRLSKNPIHRRKVPSTNYNSIFCSCYKIDIVISFHFHYWHMLYKLQTACSSIAAAKYIFCERTYTLHVFTIRLMLDLISTDAGDIESTLRAVHYICERLYATVSTSNSEDSSNALQRFNNNRISALDYLQIIFQPFYEHCSPRHWYSIVHKGSTKIHSHCTVRPCHA